MLDGQMCPVLISQADFWYPVVSSAFDESITLFFKLVVKRSKCACSRGFGMNNNGKFSLWYKLHNRVMLVSVWTYTVPDRRKGN